jgi:hypothetical protein
MFLGTEKVSVNAPRFTINSPQLHHKNTTLKTLVFVKIPCKTLFHHGKKKLILLAVTKSSRLLSKAKRRRKLLYI